MKKAQLETKVRETYENNKDAIGVLIDKILSTRPAAHRDRDVISTFWVYIQDKKEPLPICILAEAIYKPQEARVVYLKYYPDYLPHRTHNRAKTIEL